MRSAQRSLKRNPLDHPMPSAFGYFRNQPGPLAPENDLFAELPTSEYVRDVHGEWVDLRAPIREQPSGVHRQEKQEQGARKHSVRLLFIALAIGLGLVLLATAQRAFAPSQPLRLEESTTSEKVEPYWSLPIDETEPPQVESLEPPAPVVQRIQLRPVVIHPPAAQTEDSAGTEASP